MFSEIVNSRCLGILWSPEHEGNQHTLQEKEHESKTVWPKTYRYHAKTIDAYCFSFSGYIVLMWLQRILKLWSAPKTNKGMVYAFVSIFSIKNSGFISIRKFSIDI